jgi:hypothetical protein
MFIKVIQCPAKLTGNICTCLTDSIRCNNNYDKNGKRFPIRRSLPYLGMARRFLSGESIESI